MDRGEVKKFILNDEHCMGVKIDLELRRVYFGSKVLELTSKEFDILNLLYQSPEKIFSRKVLLERVWGYDYYGDSRAVDIQIRRLRKKIEMDPANPRYIMTKWGEGYFYKGSS